MILPGTPKDHSVDTICAHNVPSNPARAITEVKIISFKKKQEYVYGVI
jgi:hypothetical protein